MSRGRVPSGVNLAPKHERCECGHCRCQHAGTFAGCLAAGCECARYYWPGQNSDLPQNHERARWKNGAAVDARSIREPLPADQRGDGGTNDTGGDQC